MLKCEIDKKSGELVIRIPVLKPLRASSTGKNRLVASTGGNQTTDLVVEGQNVVVGLNAYIKNGTH